MTSHAKRPEYVTFTEGARLLVSEGIVTSMTPQGLRYIARTRDDWPFGDGRREPYRDAGRTRMMRTVPFLAYFRKHPPKGRGPAQKGREETPGGVS
jgi:hypothetical protein